MHPINEKQTKRRRRGAGSVISVSMVVIILAAAVGGLFGGAVRPAAAQTGGVSGVVASPGGGLPPNGTKVKLFEPGGRDLFAVTDIDPDGSFDLGPLPQGLYVLKAVPPTASGLTQSEPQVVSVLGSVIDVGVLSLTTPEILGTVTAPDGLASAEATVKVHAADGTLVQSVPAAGGEFLVGGLPAGSYGLQAWPVTDDPYWRSDLEAVTVNGVTQTVTLTLRPADAWGVVSDPLGNPVPEASVHAVRHGTGYRRSDVTSGSGYYAIGDLPAGDYVLRAYPPLERGALLPSEPVTVTVTSAGITQALTLLPSPKTVAGTVTTNAGDPVDQAQIKAHRLDKAGEAGATTAPDGTYRLDLSEGTWAMTVKVISTTTPTDWIYPWPAQLVHFQHNREAETRVQDFEVLVADGLVTGSVAMPDGSAPPFTVTVSLRNDEGIGRSAVITPGDLGAINLPMPNGTYKVWVRSSDIDYMGPVVAPIQVPINGVHDLGTLTLLARNSVITGTVTDSSGGGISGLPIAAWRSGAPGGDIATTGPDGQYALSVVAGDWLVRPAPGPELPYLYTGAPQEVTVAVSETVAGVDFSATETDATIVGTLVDETGTVLTDAEGWATAVMASDTVTPTLHNGAPIRAGAFTIHVPAGTGRVAAHLPTESPYLSTAERQVTVSQGTSTEITLTLTAKDARIVGALWDPRSEDVVSGVDAGVLAWSDGNWARTRVEPGNGTYGLDVAAGLWYLGYRVDPTSGYVGRLTHKNVPLTSGQTAVVPLPVLARDGEISGEVLDSAGEPLGGAVVIAEGAGPVVDNLRLHVHTEANGTFTLSVPHGLYHLGATVGVTESLKPAMRRVVVPADGISSGNVLRFRTPDATLSGDITITGTHHITGAVSLWGWSEDDAVITARAPVTASEGNYSVSVISDTTWHVGAVYESGTAYWRGQGVVSMTRAAETLDLVLEGPYAKPAPIAVTFDPAQPQRIALDDGTYVYVPANAMPAAGPVTLHIVPIATLPHQRHANVYRYGYAFNATDQDGEPITQHFNQDVSIGFGYTERELWALGISEHHLKPAYFSTTTDMWTQPEGYVIDTADNRVVIQIDHFTDFALTYDESAQLHAVFLPFTLR